MSVSGIWVRKEGQKKFRRNKKRRILKYWNLGMKLLVVNLCLGHYNEQTVRLFSTEGYLFEQDSDNSGFKKRMVDLHIHLVE